MADVIEFRKAVDAALRRARPSRERKDLARVLGVSQSELSKRLNAYHHTGKDGKERTWSLTPMEVFQIVEALVRWKGITPLASAQNLFFLMDYPLQEIDWQADPWDKLHAAPSPSAPSLLPHQQNETPSGRSAQAREQERTLYLQQVIQTNEWLMLPGGREVPLERIYVSLRADEMSVKERRAEHSLYLQEVATLAQEAQARLSDPYFEFAAVRKVLARHPKMFMLDARNWPRLFGEREQQPLTLAEVIQHHQQVVLLGDPGSGKTTLGKWLLLQFAHAFSRNETQVHVSADLVHPTTKLGEVKVLDLGLVKLPVFVSIAQYARARKPKEQSDRGITLYEYLRSGRFLDPLRLSSDLTQEAAGALVCEAVEQGQALIVLDGLDEVTDPTWRKKIMVSVQRFLAEWCHLKPETDERFVVADRISTSDRSDNRVIITSRIVGYQFDPLTNLPHYTIEEMDEPAITALYRAWMRHMATLDEDTAAEETDKLTNLLFHHAHAGVRALAGNPLLSTLLVQMYWASPERILPTNRVNLFEEVTRLMYDLREPSWDEVGIPPLRLQRALGAVAYHLHTHEPTGFTDEGQVADRLQSVLRDPEQVEAVLVAAREVSGFLVARGEGVYGFLHRSLQEYFVALYLTDPYDDETRRLLIERLARLSLDPAWREPVVLAIGIVSRSKHPENRRLETLFSALLEASDPADMVLPRREFLAAAACAECHRLPAGIGMMVAEHLLVHSVPRGQQAIPPVIRGRIRHAFRTLQRCPTPAAAETETVLCTGILDPEFERRYAAIDLVIETQWDTPAIASALVTAWRTYTAPAGSMLMALDGIAKRHPACFMPLGLPLRQVNAALVWDQTETSVEWQAIAHILYLPFQTTVRADQVNRDSPLTELLLATLHQHAGEDVLERLRQQLGPLAAHPGSVLARDAALALAALGDTAWVQECVSQAGRQEELLHPLFAALWFFLAHILDNISALVPVLSRFIARDLDLDDDHILDYNPDPDYNLNLTRELDLNLDLNRIQYIVQGLQSVQIVEGDVPSLAHLSKRTLELNHALDTLLVFSHPLVTVWKALLEAYEEQHLALMPPPPLLLTDQQDEVTPEQLKEELASLDDKRRERARQILVQERPASMLGMLCIEQMAALAQEYASDPQISSSFELALCAITHDRPEWIRQWIAQVQDIEQKTPASLLLETLHDMTPEAFGTLLQELPHASAKAKEALLYSLSRLLHLQRIPVQYHSSLLEQLMNWLREEHVPVVRWAIITTLGRWQDRDTARNVGEQLLQLLTSSTAIQQQERETLSTSLARLATLQPTLIEQVETALTAIDTFDATAFVRLNVAQAASDAPAYILMRLTSIIVDPSACLKALLQSGTDDDPWNDDYHGLLARIIQRHLVTMPDLLPQLLTALKQALTDHAWPARRMVLAAVAACSEVMPTALQQAAHGSLEELLVQGAVDVESVSSRRYALKALSSLRTLTPAVVRALLVGCQHGGVVQQDAIAAASRFQNVQGNVLDDLIPWLTGESVITAYGVAQVLRALGTSMVGSTVQLHKPIIEALVQAIEDPRSSQRKVIFADDEEETLQNVLSRVLLQVTGWVA